jgi:hypothetical protein
MKRTECALTSEIVEKKIKTEKLGPGGCSVWNEKKRRWCVMLVKSGETLCGQHQPNLRIECEHCKTSIVEKKLQSHLKKCNKLKQDNIIPNYFKKGNWKKWYSMLHTVCKIFRIFRL